MKNHTVYTATQYCISAEEVVEALRLIGLGSGAIADECRKIAAAGGPRARIYSKAQQLCTKTLRADTDLLIAAMSAMHQYAPNMPQECAAMGGA